MQQLNNKELLIVDGGISSGTCTALVVGASGLIGGGVAAYFSLGTGFSAGASVGGFYGGFIAAYACH